MLLSTVAMRFLTVIKVEVLRLLHTIQIVDMFTTCVFFFAKLLAGDGSHTGPRVHDEGLSLSVRSEVHRDVIVHEFR